MDDGFRDRRRYNEDGDFMSADEAHGKKKPKKDDEPPEEHPKPPISAPAPIWRLPFPVPIILNPCLLEPRFPGCGPGLPRGGPGD